MKKLLSILLTAVMLFSMFSVTSFAVQGSDKSVSTARATENTFSATDFFENLIQSIDDFFAELFGADKDLPDVSDWTDEEIIEYYKTAAAKTNDTAVTKEAFTLKFLKMGNSDYDKIMESVMINSWDDSQSESAGINGNYEKLVAADCSSVEAYKKGRYIVVEISLKDHSDSFKEDSFQNPISHGLDIIEDKDDVLNALDEDLTVDFSEGDIVLDYTNAKIVARINSDGYIKKGTWTYDMVMIVRNVSVTISNSPVLIENASGGFTYTGKVGGIF